MNDVMFPLSLRKKLKLMQIYPAYAIAFGNDVTREFETEIKDRMKYTKNIILEIVGETGSGKSLGGFTIAQKTLNPFKKRLEIDNFAFTNTDFIEKIQKYKTRNTILKDEQPRALYGEGSSIEQSTLQDIEEVIRKAQMNLIFISPESKAWHTGIHFILQTFDLDYTKRTNTFLIHPANDEGLRVPFGSVQIKHPIDEFPYLKSVINKYESLKDEFIQDATNQTSRAKFYQNLRKKAEILSQDTGFINQSKKNRKAHIYLKYPALASQLSKALLEEVISMAEILIMESDLE